LLNLLEVVIINMAPEALEQVFVIGGVKGRNGVRDSKPHAKDESKQGKEIPSMQG
jgi:hypothetical protein